MGFYSSGFTEKGSWSPTQSSPTFLTFQNGVHMALLLLACCLVLASAADVTTEEGVDDVTVSFEPYEETWQAYKMKFGKRTRSGPWMHTASRLVAFLSCSIPLTLIGRSATGCYRMQNTATEPALLVFVFCYDRRDVFTRDRFTYQSLSFNGISLCSFIYYTDGEWD